MSWTLTTSGSAVIKAGIHANDITLSGTELAKMSDEAEGYVENITRRKWVDNHAGLDTGIKGVLSDITSSLIGMAIVSYDNTGYLAREADMIMNFNNDRITKGMTALKDFKSNDLKAP
ncbi:hypothetical protein LCGC14_3164740 [marine sediment metagenome]|uniref:Uncharacterized protein n=1 Tax=marine sediment metagenome TaxID=412755 RepID=A0A0F8VNH6_9ZZZZ